MKPRASLSLLICLLASVLLAGKGQTAFPTTADPIHETLVFAEVHPWDGTPAADGSWSRWNETGHNPDINDILSVFWPSSGPYSTNDPATAATMGSRLASAGVNVAVIDWVTAYANEQGRMENLLSNMGSAVKRVVMVDCEPAWTGETFASVQNRVNTAAGWYGARTDLFPYYYHDPTTGQPVVFVWDPGSVATVDDWNSFISWHKTQTTQKTIFVCGLGFSTSVDWARASLFDGCLMLSSKTSTSDQSNIQWVLWKLNGETGTRGQFLIAHAIPGFNDTTNCYANDPVVDRQGGSVFDAKWGGVINSVWSKKPAYKVNHAYVQYQNDGEDTGIEPASSAPPQRGVNYQTCGGRVPAPYQTYAPVAETYYLTRNAYWASRFRSSR